MRNFKLFIPVMGLVFMITSCQQGPGPLATIIPEDVVGVIYLEDPVGTLKNVSALADSLGLTVLTDNKTPDIWFQELEKVTEGKLKGSWFDLSRPAVIALLQDSTPFLAIPVKPDTDAFKGIQTFITETFSLKTQEANGWIVATASEVKLPVAKGFDFSKMTTGTKDSVKYYLDISKALTMAGMTTEQMQGLADGFLNEAEGLGSQAGILKMMVKRVVDGIGQLKTYTGAMSLKTTGLGFYNDLSFTAGGSVNALLAAQGPVKGTREFLKYIPQDYLFGFISNLDASVWKKDTLEFNRAMYTAQGLDPQFIDFVEDYQNSLVETLGNRIAFSFDFDFDLPALTAGDMGKGLKIFFVGVVDAKDPKKFREKTMDYISSPVIKNYISGLMASSGLSLAMGFELEQGKKDGELEYDSIKLKFTGEGEMTDMLKGLDLQLNFAYQKDKIYMSLGTGSIETLKDLVAGDAYKGKTWVQGLEGLEAAYPDNAHLAGNFNIGRLLTLIRKVPQASMVPAGLPGTPGLLGNMILDNGTIKTAAGWNFKEMEALIKPFASFIPLFLNGN